VGLTNLGLIDAHIHEIDTVLQEEKDVEEHHEPPLVNFEKWTHLKKAAMDVLRYRNIPPEYDEDGLETAVAYLKRGLQVVTVDEDFSQLLQAKSAKLERNEKQKRTHNAVQAAGIFHSVSRR
jgi:hypothetical protein